MKRPFAAWCAGSASKVFDNCLGFAVAALCSRASAAVTEKSGLLKGGWIGGGCCFLKAEAADNAVFWNSMVLGVEDPNCKKLPEDGLGTGNIDPDPPGVKPLRIPDSFGVNPERMWWVSNPNGPLEIGP